MIQYNWILFLNYLVAAWIEIYNGVHEFRTVVCYNNQNYCIYGFRNIDNDYATFLNCTTTPLTAVILERSQMQIIENYISLVPPARYFQQLIVFDVYFINQWYDDVLLFEYNNQPIQELHYSTTPALLANGLCDTIEYEVKTFIFNLPQYTSNPSPYPQFTISNPNIQAMIRNVHSSYLECYPTCSKCSGALKEQCLYCKGNMQLINGECRCSIRQIFLYTLNECVDKCSVINKYTKPINRVCSEFYHGYLFNSDLGNNQQNQYIFWNIIYDPMHISTQNKKGSPYFLGVLRFREGIYISIDSQFEPYPLSIYVYLIFCNETPLNSGLQFQINQIQYGSIYYDGQNYQFDNVYVRDYQQYPTTGSCTNNKLMQLEMFFQFYQKKFIFSITGNFTDENTGWFIKSIYIGNGNCPSNCLKCDQNFFCKICNNGYRIRSDGACVSSSCPKETTWNGTFCVRYNDRTKYTAYLIKEFYDFIVSDTILNIFILETSTPNDLQKGENIIWSYEATSIVFGGKYVWTQARFSQIYNLDPHHSLTIYFLVIFGSKFPNSPSNYLQYEINNGTQVKIQKNSNLNIVEEINEYNSELAIAFQCFGGNVVDQYCAISNYYITVHYCRPFCLQCTNEFDCQQWDTFDPDVVKLFSSNCSSNQFLDEIYFTCEPCPQECLTCFNEYECLSCQNNYHLYKTTCLFDCLVNQYFDGLICQDCLYSCKQCTTFSDCINCEVTYLRYLQNGHCICYDGYYDQPNTPLCQSCNILCKTCIGPTNNDCLSCISLTNIIQIGQTCQCQDGYYFDQNQIQCQLCNSQCQTCFGNSNSNCLSCYPNQVRQLKGFLCVCQEGYYEFNSWNYCLQCPSVVNNQLLQCFKECGDQAKKWFNLSCNAVSCQDGFNNVQDKCIPICGDSQINGDEECDDGNNIQYDGCYNCRFQCPVQCTTCNSATSFPCPDICGDGHTTGAEECDDGNNIQYDGCYECKIECQIQCTKCLKGICSECQTFGWILNPSTSLCIENCGDSLIVGNEECDDGYNFDRNDNCFNCKFLCRDDCLICSDDGKTCLECKTIGFKPQNYYCVNICGDGYLAVDPFNRYIEQCDDFNLVNQDGCGSNCYFQCQPIALCTICQNNKCQSCIPTYYLDTAKNKCIELCYDNIIVGNEKCEDMNNQMNDGCYNCQLSCQNSCETCTITGCQVCKTGYQLIDQICKNICGDNIIVNDEDCDDGNLNPFDGCHQCQYFCDSYCKVCHKGRCLECENGFEKVYFRCVYKQKMEALTLIQYYENENVINCQIQFQNTCLKCYDQFELNVFNNQCYYIEEKVNFDIKINQIYQETINSLTFKQLSCKHFLNENDCLECLNNFSLNFITQDCNSKCGDKIVNGLEQCEDSNLLMFDGCYDCQYQCCENCELCSYGRCNQCKVGYFWASEISCEIIQVCTKIGFYYDELKNKCYDICGDGIISENEQCDDANETPYDGCYLCKYQCPKQCSVCEKGKCIICERGLYYNLENFKCEPFCGDGIIIQPYEECDDGNEIDSDGCDNCLLRCNNYCQVCDFQNKCAVCKDNYELINQICEEGPQAQCSIENCFECKNGLCISCKRGFVLENNICEALCGDGILVDLETCDDGNLVNNDGCDNNCTPSKNSLCNTQECILINFPTLTLSYLYEILGEQYVLLQYNQKMQIVEQCSLEHFIQSLDFRIKDQSDNVTQITIIDQNEIIQSLLDQAVQIKITFFEMVDEPILLLNISNTSYLENEFGITLQEKIYLLDLKQPNILSSQEQKSVKSLISLSEQNLKIFAFCIGFASLTGQQEIVENILETIQQLYYFKYINSRVGINLEQYFQTFKIIQLTNVLTFLNLNPTKFMQSQFQYINSEIVFQLDDRNSNFLENLLYFITVFIIYTLAFFCLKFLSKYFMKFTIKLDDKFQNRTLFSIVIFLIKGCKKIKKLNYFSQFQFLILPLIYEFGIAIGLALKYSRQGGQGILGFWMALIVFHGVLLKIILMTKSRSSVKKLFGLPIIQYQCFQKLYFSVTLILFYNTAIIQIFYNLINEVCFCATIYKFQIFEHKAENVKKFLYHLFQVLILILYLFNEYNQENVQTIIKIAWAIISLMSFSLLSTALIDLITLLLPVLQKIIANLSQKNKQTTNEIIQIFTFSKDGGNQVQQNNNDLVPQT